MESIDVSKKVFHNSEFAKHKWKKVSFSHFYKAFIHKVLQDTDNVTVCTFGQIIDCGLEDSFKKFTKSSLEYFASLISQKLTDINDHTESIC